MRQAVLAVVWVALYSTLATAQIEQPRLAPNTSEPLTIKYFNSRLADICKQVGQLAGIEIRFASDVDSSTRISISLEKVTIEQALQELAKSSNLTYKVTDPKTVLIQRSDSKP